VCHIRDHDWSQPNHGLTKEEAQLYLNDIFEVLKQYLSKYYYIQNNWLSDNPA